MCTFLVWNGRAVAIPTNKQKWGRFTSLTTSKINDINKDNNYVKRMLRLEASPFFSARGHRVRITTSPKNFWLLPARKKSLRGGGYVLLPVGSDDKMEGNMHHVKQNHEKSQERYNISNREKRFFCSRATINGYSHNKLNETGYTVIRSGGSRTPT